MNNKNPNKCSHLTFTGTMKVMEIASKMSKEDQRAFAEELSRQFDYLNEMSRGGVALGGIDVQMIAERIEGYEKN